VANGHFGLDDRLRAWLSAASHATAFLPCRQRLRQRRPALRFPSRQIDTRCEEARQDVFDYIEMFYNPKRKHVRNGMLSPVEFERQHEM
jgi:hypothetical protein